MKRRTVIQVVAILVAVASTESKAEVPGFPILKLDASFNFADEPIKKICEVVGETYDVIVFLEKGVDVKLSTDGTNSTLGEDLSRWLKPHGLHVHGDVMGIYISKKPVPYNATYLGGNVEIELPIPPGRKRAYGDSFSTRWEKSGSDIRAGWRTIGNKSLAQTVEEDVALWRDSYGFTPKPTSMKKDGTEYVVMRANRPPDKFNKEPRVFDTISFKNQNYLYTISHSYPAVAAEAGAAISKRLLESLRWQEHSKYERVTRR